MKVVVVGKGGREHAMAQKIKESSLVTDLWVCPGNPGMTRAGLNCATAATAQEITEFCVQHKVSLVVVGPEALILSDLKTLLAKNSILCFAPDKEVAALEASKIFCKEILQASGVRTAQSLTANNISEGKRLLATHDFTEGLVLKADGLAQGKGVWVCETLAQAEKGLESLAKQFGFPILFEECLVGKELSAFALCDNEDFVVLGTACDYKRITEDPFSANTGGMGAYSPCDFITAAEEKEIQEIFAKTLKCLNKKNMPYQGFLFAGLMKTSKGLYVLEYNVRMGDPETQVLLPRIESDLVSLIWAAVRHDLQGKTCKLSAAEAVHVVVASRGYPQPEMALGHPIEIADDMVEKNVTVYYAGVDEKNKKLINVGGRVLGVTALAETRKQARDLAYAGLQKIKFQGMYSRKDIGV